MRKWKIIYHCDNGCKGEVFVHAANRIMAYRAFKSFDIKNVIASKCFLANNKI